MPNKIKIKIGIIGHIPFAFNWKRIKKWKSEIFEIVDDIQEYHFKEQPLDSWKYSDTILDNELPARKGEDIFIGITYVSFENDYYARRLSSNRIAFSYFRMYDTLKRENIPMENLLLRAIYRYILVYLRNGNIIPQQKDLNDLHNDVRGCILDSNANQTDVIFSLDRPKICDKCIEKIREHKVSDNQITQIKKEILRIRKEHFYKITEFIKTKPILSIIISALFGFVLNLTANVVYERFVKVFLCN